MITCALLLTFTESVAAQGKHTALLLLLYYSKFLHALHLVIWGYQGWICTRILKGMVHLNVNS